ncbi:MAG: hypothetical protein WEA09_02300 [Gemmatimonadota bacterium]
MAKKSVPLSHWHQLLGNAEASAMDFYASVEEAIERRAVPDTDLTRVEHHEGGVLSARREYLRVRRGRYCFDICGAPFGTGFFVSWWFGELRAGPLRFVAVAVGLYIIWSIVWELLGIFLGIMFFFFGLPWLVWLLARHTPEELAGWDDPIRSLPVVGPMYGRWFRPETYYEVDTFLMFRSAVHSAVLEAVDELTAAQGVKALSELERKPINEAFMVG